MDTLLYSRQYADLDAKLTGRCSQSRKVANNTYLERRPEGDIAVRLHATDVVTFHPDGTATLNSGGWLTVTTKSRINDYLPGGIVLSSIKGRWYLVYSGHGEYDAEGNWHYVPSERRAVPYSDGVTVDLASLDVIGGEAAAEAVKAEDSANEKMRKAVAAYVAKTTPEAIVKAFENSAGDCLLCNWSGREVEADHLRLHVDEQYVMYSLTRNAVTERGFMNPDLILHMIYSAAKGGQVDRIYKDSVRKYLRKHLTVGACATK